MGIFNRKPLAAAAGRHASRKQPAACRPCGGSGAVNADKFLAMTGGGVAVRGSYRCPDCKGSGKAS